jgi:hypothetical protein
MLFRGPGGPCTRVAVRLRARTRGRRRGVAFGAHRLRARVHGAGRGRILLPGRGGFSRRSPRRQSLRDRTYQRRAVARGRTLRRKLDRDADRGPRARRLSVFRAVGGRSRAGGAGRAERGASRPARSTGRAGRRDDWRRPSGSARADVSSLAFGGGSRHRQAAPHLHDGVFLGCVARRAARNAPALDRELPGVVPGPASGVEALGVLAERDRHGAGNCDARGPRRIRRGVRRAGRSRGVQRQRRPRRWQRCPR